MSYDLLKLLVDLQNEKYYYENIELFKEDKNEE